MATLYICIDRSNIKIRSIIPFFLVYTSLILEHLGGTEDMSRIEGIVLYFY